MPPPVFIEMSAFRPDGGAFGPELSLVQNYLPVHAGWAGIRKKQRVASVADGPMTGAYVHIYQQAASIQKGRAISDGSAVWTPSTGAVLFDRINESVPSDTEYVFAGGAPVGVQQAFPVTVLVDPASAADHYFRFRYRVPSTTGAWTVTADLADKLRPVTSITRAGATATATTPVAHGWSTGQIVLLSGAGQPEYVGRFTITVTGGTTFTFPVTGTPATPATGTLLVRAIWASDAPAGAVAQLTFVQREVLLTATQANAINDNANLFFLFTATVAGAAQFARPASDVSAGSWTASTGAASLYTAVDEFPASDIDFILTPTLALGGTSYVYVGGLGSLVDPMTDAGFTFRYRMRANNSGITGTARLRQGATLIKEVVTVGVATAYALSAVALTTAEMALVTDFTQLRGEFEASWPAAAASTVFQVSRPSADLTNIGWTSTAASRYTEIDEAVPSDADGITGSSTLANICEMSLSGLVAPGSTADHSFTIRASAPVGNSLIVRVLSAGILVKQYDFGSGAPALTPALGTYTLTLTAGEASLISNYASLSLYFEAYGTNHGVGVSVTYFAFQAPERRWAEVSFLELEGPSPSRAEVSWVEAQIPDIVQTYRGDVNTIFSGSKTKLYEVDNAAFTDRSKVGGYGLGAKPGAWRFCSFGNDVIATNRADPIQYRADNAGLFLDLITDPTPAPKARFCAAVRDHVVFGDINLVGHYPDEIWWTAFDDARRMALLKPETQADNQRIVSRPGQIMGLVGGDYGVIFKRNSMHLLGWQGGQLVFRVDDISPTVGTPYPSSIVQTPQGVFWFDGSTFRRYAGGTGESSVPDIGTGILSQLLSDVVYSTRAIIQTEPADIAAEDQIMIGYYDAFARVVIWTYQDTGGAPSRHTRGIVYNPAEDRWGAIYDPGLSSSYMTGKLNVVNGDTFLLKGGVGFDWDGTTTSWFRFDSATTYEGVFMSKRQSLGIQEADDKDPQVARITSVLPIFSYTPEGSSIPDIRVLVEGSNDPFFTTDLKSKTTTKELANSQGWMAVDIAAFWFRFTVTIPEMTAQQARAFRGLYITWQKVGSPGNL